VPVAANEGCRVTKAVGILSEPKTVGGPEDPLNFKSTITADGSTTPAMEDEMETSSPAADGCAAYNFTGTFANDMTSMTPNAVGDGVNVGIVSNTTTIREGVGGAGTYIVVTDGIPGSHGVLMCSTSVRTGKADESILECASTGSRGFASIYPGAVDEECNVVEANLLLLVSWVINCEDQACVPFAAQGSLSRV